MICRDCLKLNLPSPCAHAAEPWLIFSPRDGAYWRPESNGYTNNLLFAGVYTAERAAKICDGLGNRGDYPIPLSTRLKDIMSDTTKPGTVGVHLGMFPKIADYLGGLQ